MEKEQAAAVLSAPSWDLLEARRSDPGAGRGAGAAAAEPSGPPGRPPGAWRWKGARSQEPPETLGRGNPRALQLFPHTAEEKDKGPRSAGISGRSQEQGVRTEPGAGDLYYWPRRTGKLQGSHHDPQPKMVNGPSWHEGRTIAPPGRALAQNGSSLEGVHERGGPRRGNSTNPRLQLKNPFYPLTQESYGAYAVMCLSVVIFGTGIIGNLAVMCIVCHNYYMRSISNSLLANLAFWDFLIIFFCLPLVIFHELTKKWLLEDFSCKIVPYIEVCLPGGLKLLALFLSGIYSIKTAAPGTYLPAEPLHFFSEPLPYFSCQSFIHILAFISWAQGWTQAVWPLTFKLTYS